MIQNNKEPKNIGNNVHYHFFDKKIWTVSEVAVFLDRSVGTIYNLVNQGKLPHYKRGKRLYFNPRLILSYVQEGD